MILELDTTLFNIGDISINQLVFLTLCLNNNQKPNQDVHQFLSRISETEIQSLVDQQFISITTLEDGTKVYNPTETLLSLVKEDKTWFDVFYETYPTYVTRPDGTKGFLRANLNKCRKEYNRIVGKSKAMHEHLLECLNYEIQSKMMTGKLGYMKTMWKWLTQHEWEIVEEEMLESTSVNTVNYNDIYGTDIR